MNKQGPGNEFSMTRSHGRPNNFPPPPELRFQTTLKYKNYKPMKTVKERPNNFATPPPIPIEALNQSIESQNGQSPLYTMKGLQDLMEVYADKVAITPIELGIFSKGLRGTKTIPFTSITAVRFKKGTTLVWGCIAFTVPGEYQGDSYVRSAWNDENAFLFLAWFNENERALEIKNYIERRVEEMRSAPSTAPSSIADELQKLAALKAQGVLSESEFEAAKKRLLSKI